MQKNSWYKDVKDLISAASHLGWHITTSQECMSSNDHEMCCSWLFPYSQIGILFSIRWIVISVILVSSKNPLLLQDSNLSHLDLGLCLKGRNSDLDSVGQSKEDRVKRASSGGLWAIG
ncbi:hypothetical protein Peur_061153 [Populus x canadensis]|jgi:hypothetical protein